MRSSYKAEDVEILLKDITGLVEPLPASVREQKIQSGTHYCEMLPLEYKPTEKYMEAYSNALDHYAVATARAVGILAEKIYEKKGNSAVIVSLARAGIPIGILVKRYIRMKYNVDMKHYSISIIRGRGIDDNAMKYILSRHDKSNIQFIDGWTGKGAILRQLQTALHNYQGVSNNLGVVSDPAGITDLCGTHEDILIPSSCLNATVTGLISRTFLRNDLIGPDDFHGAAYYDNLEKDDLSEQFLTAIESNLDFNYNKDLHALHSNYSGMTVVQNISKKYRVEDINFIKPGIGEATRVLLRRIPWKVLINGKYGNADELKHIYQLAKEKNVPVEVSAVPMGNYKVCGIIKKLQDL